MLNKISIDIVEMVIVLSDKYSLFESLQKILSKLTESNRKARINDKMTKMYEDFETWPNDYMVYKLNGRRYREYGKPFIVDLRCRLYLGDDDEMLIFEKGRQNGPEYVCTDYRYSGKKGYSIYTTSCDSFLFDQCSNHTYMFNVYQSRRKNK